MNPSRPLAAFFDLDGTLALNNQPPARRDVEAIRAFRAQGNYAFLCTGRSLGYLYPAVFDIGFDGIVSGAGAHVTVGDQLLFRTCIDPALLDGVLHRFETAAHTLILECETAMIQLLPPQATQFVPRYPVIHSAAEWYADHSNKVVSKLTIYGHPLPPDIRAMLEEPFFLIEHPTYYEAAPKGCSKSAGIRRVMAHLDIPRENVIAVGDSPNDADMIAFAGLGVAMGDGVPAVQAIADYVTLPLADCGVAHLLENLHTIL